MSDTLILNTTYEPLSILPLSIITWQRSIKLYWVKRIEVMHYYEDWVVHSPSIALRVPAVAMTTEFFDFKKAIRYSKQNIYLRDLYTCQYCGDTFDVKELTIDHVVPKSHGGKSNWTNCVTACIPCNAKKGDRIEYMFPKKDPYKPDWRAMAYSMKNKPFTIKHPSWAQYLEPYRKIA